MSHQRDTIRSGLQELSKAGESGRDCWVTFEANGPKHWLQCTPTQINMAWPFSSPPSENKTLKICFGAGYPIQIDAWKADSYLTLTLVVRNPDALISGIEGIFQDMYGLGATYTLTYKIEDA